MNRNGNNPATLQMDALTYGYKSENTGGSTVRRSSNILLSYNDIQAYASRYSDDADGYGLAFDAADPGTWNYKYDEIGNLVQDNSEQIANIEWDVYGKIKKITRSNGSTKSDLEFIYDPMGTRVGKIEKPRTGGTLQNESQWQYTWYTHDAQGQTLATHSMSYEQAGTRYKARYHTDEEYLFGSSRLGVLLTEALPEKTREFNYSGYLSDGRFNITSWADESITPVTPCQSHCVEAHVKTMGNRRYELKDHLGNVWATVSDVKSYSGGNFVAEIKSAQSYYPFGSLQPGRNFNAGDYRFGFNGKENDNEVKGTGNSVDFGARIYDSRLGRWMSTDPLQQKYPNQSPYNFCGNNPILFVDFDGRDYGVTVEHTETGGTITIKATFYTAKGNTESHNSALHAAQYWKDQSGKYQYKVGEGKDALYYDVKFELDVVEVDNPDLQSKLDRLPANSLNPGEVQLTPDWTSNTYEVLPDNDKKFIDPKNPQNTVNGVTSDGNQVAVSESNKDGDTGPHELGHALGFEHMFGSIMSESMNNGHTGDINKTIISIMLSNVKIGPSPVDNIFKGTGNGVRKPDVGTAPANFNDGKVIKKPKK